MSHTPWLGVAMARFCGREDRVRQSYVHYSVWKEGSCHYNSRDTCAEWINKPGITRPPYCRIGAGRTLPVTSAMSSFTLIPNSWMYGSRLKLAFFICVEWMTSITSHTCLCDLHSFLIFSTILLLFTSWLYNLPACWFPLVCQARIELWLWS